MCAVLPSNSMPFNLRDINERESEAWLAGDPITCRRNNFKHVWVRGLVLFEVIDLGRGESEIVGFIETLCAMQWVLLTFLT